MKDQTISRVANGVLFVTLVGTALAKLFAILFRPDTIPDRWIVEGIPTIPLLATVASAELVLAAGLATRWRAIAARTTLAMFVSFAGMLCWLVAHGHDVSTCGCFGGLDAPASAHFAFVAAVAWLAYSVATQPLGKPRTQSTRALHPV